jgi:hypothetical protein
MTAADCNYPRALLCGANGAEWPVVHGLGNSGLLGRPVLGLICSVQVPGQVILKTLDAVRELRDAGVVVAGGFHSPLEQECLGFLLRGPQPVIVCPARHPSTHRLPADWVRALDCGRLVIASPFGPEVVRPTRRLAEERNRFVTALAAALWIPHASAGGQTAQLLEAELAAGKPVFLGEPGDDPATLPAGVRDYRLSSICDVLGVDGTGPAGQRA